MSRRLLGCLIALFSVFGFGCAQAPPVAKLPEKAPGRYVEQMKSGGFDRSFILDVPKAYDATKPLPLVILLHGWTASAEYVETAFGMADAAQKNGFVLVVPNGVGQPQGWNAGFINLSGKQVDDVAFIDELIGKVEGEVGIDADRVFVAGHSNGAFLAHLLGDRLSNKIAAIAAVAGTVGVPKDGGMKMLPEPVGPVSVLLIHGKADPMVSYDSKHQALLNGVGALDSARWWAQRDGCSTTPSEVTSGNGNVITDTFGSGKNGTEVTLVTIVNGTHDWPGGSGRDGQESRSGVHGADLIWSFFAAHPKSH